MLLHFDRCFSFGLLVFKDRTAAFQLAGGHDPLLDKSPDLATSNDGAGADLIARRPYYRVGIESRLGFAGSR